MLLRPEARALSWSRLEDAQKQAITRVVDLLIEAIESIPGENQEEFGRGAPESFRIDNDRASRIVLLSGRRGTGKTTVLLTLRDLCRPERKPLPGDEIKDEEVRKKIAQVADRAIWLEPIDMEPLAESTNLLAAVLARINDAAQGPQARDEDVKPRGLLDPGPDYQDALLDLQRLENDVALAWDGNLSSRSAHIDPDHFAVEVMRAEHVRLALNRKLRDVLDKLARDVFRDRGRERAKGGRIFIIPVDDFDLNPVRCLELLRILRMISVPRLFALVLGDVKVAETVFNLKLCGDLNRLADRLEGSKLVSYASEDVLSMTSGIAASAMRKLIPPAQVVRLEFMTAGEALAFHPAGTQAIPLHKILELLPLYEKTKEENYHERQTLENLRRFFLVQPFHMVKSAPSAGMVGSPAEVPARTPANSSSEEDRTTRAANSAKTSELDQIKKDVDESPYMVKELFQTSPRKIADLWHGLVRLIDEGEQLQAANNDWKKSEHEPEVHHTRLTPRVVLEIINVFAHHCDQAISEDRVLTPEGKQVLHEALTATSRHWELDPGALRADLKEWPEHVFEFPTHKVPGADLLYSQVMHARRSKGWRIQVLVCHENRSIPVPMERSTAATLMALYDLISCSQAGPYGETLWEEMASRRKPPQDKAVTRWRVYPRQSVSIPWPDYPWASFREYDVFTSLWKDAIDWVARHPLSPESQLEHLVFAWIDIHYAVLEWKEPIGFSPPAEGEVHPAWGALKKRLVEFFRQVKDSEGRSKRHVTHYPALGWYTQFALLLMPETIGSHHSINKAMFQDNSMMEIYRHWDEKSAYIRASRLANYQRFVEEHLEWLGKELCFRPVGQREESGSAPPEGDTGLSQDEDDNERERLLAQLVPAIPEAKPVRG